MYCIVLSLACADIWVLARAVKMSDNSFSLWCLTGIMESCFSGVINVC